MTKFQLGDEIQCTCDVCNYFPVQGEIIEILMNAYRIRPMGSRDATTIRRQDARMAVEEEPCEIPL